jgi:hypothetical protein
VACTLGGRAGSDVADSTFKKALRKSHFIGKGKGKQWVLVPAQHTPMDVESTSSVGDEADADKLEGASTSDRRKRQRTTASDSSRSTPSHTAMQPPSHPG